MDDVTPDLSLIPSKDKELYISLLEIEMYEHFKNRRKRKPRDQPENKKSPNVYHKCRIPINVKNSYENPLTFVLNDYNENYKTQ